jgi:hypothetical protein
LFKTSFIFKHSYSRNNISITHSFLHNSWRSIGTSMVFMVQSLEGREEKLSILCNNNNFLSYAMNDQHNLPFDSSLWSNIKATILWVLESLTQSMKSKKGLKTWGTCCCMLAPSFFTLVCMSISSMFVKASIWRPYHMIMVDL